MAPGCLIWASRLSRPHLQRFHHRNLINIPTTLDQVVLEQDPLFGVQLPRGENRVKSLPFRLNHVLLKARVCGRPVSQGYSEGSERFGE